MNRLLPWLLATVSQLHEETADVKTITFDVPGWRGHLAGQHVDIRLTAEDGYVAQRSYSLASPAGPDPRIQLTVERVDDGEVSPFLLDELRVGDSIELRGPIGGYFTWSPGTAGPLMLIAGGSGIAPLMSMLRTRAYSLEPRAGAPSLLVSIGAAHHLSPRTRPAAWGGRRLHPYAYAHAGGSGRLDGRAGSYRTRAADAARVCTARAARCLRLWPDAFRRCDRRSSGRDRS